MRRSDLARTIKQTLMKGSLLELGFEHREDVDKFVAVVGYATREARRGGGERGTRRVCVTFSPADFQFMTRNVTR